MSVTNELRSLAESIGLAVPQAATLMMDAADDIDRLDAESARLRDAVRVLVYCGAHIDCDGCPLNGNPYDTHATVEWFACDTLREMIDELEVEANS